MLPALQKRAAFANNLLEVGNRWVVKTVREKRIEELARGLEEKLSVRERSVAERGHKKEEGAVK